MLFLANIQPDLQREVREQCEDARFVAHGLDEPVDRDRARLAACRRSRASTALLLNDAELRELTGQAEPRARRAGGHVAGARGVVVAKQGEYGAALFTSDGFFALPAYPLETVVDPTGAGDTFAGGFVGYLAAHPTRRSTTSCCAGRWPTARRWPPTTSRSSAPSASRG